MAIEKQQTCFSLNYARKKIANYMSRYRDAFDLSFAICQEKGAR
jgi:hypothetical protein